MIWSVLLGIFFILHAIVHLLYAGQALRFFELRPDLTWPDGAWAFSRLLGDEFTRTLAAVFLAVTAVSFLAGGLGLLFKQEWWRLTTIGAAALSILVYLLLWDGKLHELHDKGGVGLAISLVILIVVFKFGASS